ncbi:PGF-pre-PGF domain-containing protein [Methanococcoides methylutens]|uniref:PGF-pre-PGF domain-containing protein n=1 Tax=Methanococcoides methylutens TaxID=2226 RepID=UPI0040447A5A
MDTSSSSSGGSSGGSSSSGGGGGGSGSTGEAFENIAFKAVRTENIVDGLKISYVFDDEQNPIRYINFSALRNYQKVSTTIEVLKSRSAMVDESAPGLVHSNFNIWVGKSGFATENNIADPVIGFRVSKDWITENGIDENSIAIYRHSEGKWNALDTEKIGEDDSYIYFEAETPGFSPFAIAADVDDEVLTDNTISIEEDSHIVINVGTPEDDLPASEPEEANNLWRNLLLFAIPMLMVLIVLYTSYTKARGRAVILPDDMQVAESDVSETASDSTTAEEVSGESAETTATAEEVSGESVETTATAEEVSGESVETTPTAEEILGYSVEKTPNAQENEVRSDDTEQNVKEMKESRINPDDKW